MAQKKTQKRHKRDRRHRRIRKKVIGTPERPRLCVQRSLNHLAVQLIDDSAGRTLLGLSTYSKEFRDKVKRGNVEGAKILGRALAEQAKSQKIQSVVFDRGGCRYHGRIRALADAAREAGLVI